jgi:hypothetical protein
MSTSRPVDTETPEVLRAAYEALLRETAAAPGGVSAEEEAAMDRTLAEVAAGLTAEEVLPAPPLPPVFSVAADGVGGGDAEETEEGELGAEEEEEEVVALDEDGELPTEGSRRWGGTYVSPITPTPSCLEECFSSSTG